MKKVIICNCPAQTGKDVFAKYMSTRYGHTHLEFKTKLIELTRSIYDVSKETWDEIYVSGTKETPMDIFDGLSPREALIYVSEDVIKPKFGKNYFGKSAAKQLKDGLNIFSDGGFFDEINEVVKVVGVENVIFFEFERDNKTFEGDSRKRVNFDGIHRIVFDNNGTISDLERFAELVHMNYIENTFNYRTLKAASSIVLNSRDHIE